MATVVMGNPSTTERARIYLAFRTVFTGPHAGIRKAKKVREVVEQLEDNFEPLLSECGVVRTVEILKSLLEEQVFESETKAAAEFPELFDSTPFRDVQRRQLERSAAKTTTATLQEESAENDAKEAEDVIDEESQTSLLDRKDPIKSSLYPIMLPYHAQHLILNTAQRQLEECCFEFAQRWLPSFLEQKGLTCPEAVELTKWKSYIPPKVKSLPPDVVVDSPVKPLMHAFLNVDNLRHAAVHRSPTTIRGILTWIASAGELAEALGDKRRSAAFRRLFSELNSRFSDIKLNKNFLEARFDGELRDITQMRVELDRREKAAQELMRNTDKENMRLVASSLQTAVAESFSSEIQDSENAAQDVESLVPSYSSNIQPMEGTDNTIEEQHAKQDENRMSVGNQATEDAQTLVANQIPADAQLLIDTLNDVSPSDFEDTRHLQAIKGAQTAEESPSLVEVHSSVNAQNRIKAADLADTQDLQATEGAQNTPGSPNIIETYSLMDADNLINDERLEDTQIIEWTEGLEQHGFLPREGTKGHQTSKVILADSTSPPNTEDAELQASASEIIPQGNVSDNDQESDTPSPIPRSGWRSWWWT